MKRFLALDGFRGLCALSIVVVHLHVLNSVGELRFFRSANLFVEFFFVLSGFVFFYSYESKVFDKKSLNRFIVGKTFRLFPLHVFMLGILIFIEFGKWFAESKGLKFNNAAFTGPNSVGEIIPNLFLIQAWLGSSESLSFNHPSWFISILYYIYFICYFLVIAGGRFLKQIVFVLAVISYVGWSLNNGFVKGGVLTGLSCFFSGCVAYCLYEKNSNIQFGKAVFNFLEIGSLILGYVIVTSGLDEKHILASLIFCLITIIFSFERGWLSSVLKIEVIRYLGKLSFSIYMIHAAIIFCLISLAMIGSKLFGVELTIMRPHYLGDEIRYVSLGNAFVDNFVFFGILSLIVFLSSLTYRFIELKGINVGRKINEKLLQ